MSKKRIYGRHAAGDTISDHDGRWLVVQPNQQDIYGERYSVCVLQRAPFVEATLTETVAGGVAIALILAGLVTMGLVV